MIGRYVADFVCFEKRLIIELDGGHHQAQQEYDWQRTLVLNSVGFRVLRFWNHQVLSEAEWVLAEIRRALMDLSPLP